MQPLAWYVKRLQRMSAGEIAWRVQSACGNLKDLYDLRRGRLPLGPLTEPPRESAAIAPHVWTAVPPGAWAAAAPDSAEARWAAALRRAANPIVAHRFTFFNLTDRHFGDPIDWNRDHGSGRAAPLAFSASIDYRDFERTGDCKFVWEPNRHQHLVVLARAYRATGERRYADAVVEQLTSWLDQSPFGRGMNWRSPLELAIRVINWTWTWDLLRPSEAIGGAFQRRLLEAVELHVREIGRKYSRASSANNHRIGEAAGVFVASTYFPWMRGAADRADEARRILADEITRQTYDDGGTREQAFGYHVFVAQFFLVAGLAARHSGQDFPDAYWRRFARMLEFIAALAAGGTVPAVGDADDGYVLDLDGSPLTPASVLACGAIVLNRPDLLSGLEMPSQAVAWALPPGAHVHQAPDPQAPLGHVAFPHSGYYLLQSGRRGATDALSVLVDCGELGFGAIAAHGHADALSLTLRAGSADVLIDPGTYDYFTYPEYRAYFRSTRAHNTVVVDGVDQSAALGSFMWGRRANARCIEWSPEHGRLVAEHDGYTRLADPVRHRRTVSLAGRSVTVIDDLVMQDAHDV